MHNPLEITVDYNYFYLKDQHFFPMIQEQDFEFETLEAANSVLITLPAHADDELLWEKGRASAEKAIEQGKFIIWEMDFGLRSSQILVQESTIFYSFGIALEEFVNTLWRDFKHYTLGIVLYRGDVDFSKRFIWTEAQRELFIEKVGNQPLYKEIVAQKKDKIEEWISTPEGEYLFQLFSADVFAEYFHRLVSYLPETLLAFCLLDVSEVESNALLAQILSKERFQHILLGLKKAKVPVGHLNWEEGACLGGWFGQSYPYFSTVSDINIGVCLPADEYMHLEVLADLDAVFEELNQLRIPYRIIPESLLTEAWNGLNDIIVISSAISPQGKRKLLGFCAAGGRVISLGDSLGLEQELPFSAFRQHFSTELLI